MSKTRNSRRRGFLEEYRLDETYLLKPDRASGRPGISEGLAPDGEPVLVKNWPRNPKQNDDDLAEIWRHELRQLHRLYGYPAPGQTWPEHLNSDFAAAAVRLTTVMEPGGQHLLFGCVELFPHEIPLPPPDVKPLMKRVGDATLVSGITVMPVPDALSWYESALADGLNVPGISCDVKVTTSRLAPEPALGRLVVGGEFPFGAPWHCGPGLHHLVPLYDAPPSIAWLTAAPKSTGREKARAWLAETLGFDLLAYDEFLFSLVLLVPNPVVRSFSSFIRDRPAAGGERLGVRVRPRRGASLTDIQRFREERSEGTSIVLDCPLDRFGSAEIDLPEPCCRTGLELLSDDRGILVIEGPARFFRSVAVRTEVLASKGTVEVPGRRKGVAPATYPIQTRDRDTAFGKPVPPSAESRLIELQSRRLTRSGEARPEGFWRGADGEDIGDRPKAVCFVRNLVARAQKIAVFVDPYFNHIDVREFALATQYRDVAVHALVGRGENLWSKPGGPESDGPVAGDLFADDLRALAETLKSAALPLPDVRLMGDGARTYHDRFLVIDDSVWHFGHSFNRVGERDAGGDVSMATCLRYPDEIRDLILADIGQATPFLDGWPALKERREPRKGTPWARVAAWAGTICDAVVSPVARTLGWKGEKRLERTDVP